MRFPTHKTHLYNHGEYDSPLVKDDSVSRRQLLTTTTTTAKQSFGRQRQGGDGDSFGDGGGDSVGDDSVRDESVGDDSVGDRQTPHSSFGLKQQFGLLPDNNNDDDNDDSVRFISRLLLLPFGDDRCL